MKKTNQPSPEETWEERFDRKFNDVVSRIVNLEVIPDIQMTLKERIVRGGFETYKSDEIKQFIKKEISKAEKRVKRHSWIYADNEGVEVHANSMQIKKILEFLITRVMKDKTLYSWLEWKMSQIELK